MDRFLSKGDNLYSSVGLVCNAGAGLRINCPSGIAVTHCTYSTWPSARQWTLIDDAESPNQPTGQDSSSQTEDTRTIFAGRMSP